jgi:serine/threonine-protein kinase RsbW
MSTAQRRKHDRLMTPPDIIRLDLPATHTYLNVLDACLEALLARVTEMESQPDLAHAVLLAVHEACTNIVDHAYAGMQPARVVVTMRVEVEPRRLVFELQDTGRSFDLATIPEPDLAEGQIRGYGLFLMRQILDDVDYTALPDGNHWRLTKRL